MEEAWDWVEEELKKIQEEMPVDSEAMQVVDAISVADFWKRRYDEERMLWERKLETREGEKKTLQDKALGHEMSIKELDWKLKELEKRWEQEKLLLEDRLKTKEVETALEKTKLQWETRLKILEEENKVLKFSLGRGEGIAVAPGAGMTPLPESGPVSQQLKEREETLKKNEEEAKARLEKLEAERREVSQMLTEKEKAFSAEREKWQKLEKEVGQMSGQMEQKLSNLKDREEEHFVILEDLARGFAHRVRNYLGIMSGTVQLCLANYKMESELDEQLKIVDQNVQEMLKSIEDFLSLARIPEMNMQPMNLNQVFDTVTQAVQEKLRSQNITVSKNYDGALPLFKCDPKLMDEAVKHLIENSVEAMAQGGQLTLSTAYDKSRDLLSLKISDTGSGISEAHIKKVFQPYFSSKKNHRGLGLTVAKRVIDLHRGTLNLESTKGKGTVITINLLMETPA